MNRWGSGPGGQETPSSGGFDTTSIYFEGEGGVQLGQYGHSKDHRPDCKQMVVVCMNEEQARKDRADRQAIVESLREQLKHGDKALVGNKGYRKYLHRLGRLNAVATDHFRETLGQFFRRYAYNEWYPLNKEEAEVYQADYRQEPIQLYDWQK